MLYKLQKFHHNANIFQEATHGRICTKSATKDRLMDIMVT